jgi:putative hydrolases of HD superfamily
MVRTSSPSPLITVIWVPSIRSVTPARPAGSRRWTGRLPGRPCHWHDSQETRVGDIPHLGRRYLQAASNEQVTQDQTTGLPAALASQLRALIDEYENADGPEVRCAHDADKLECLFQAIEYRDSGHQNVGGWIESSRARLRTKSAERLADAAIAMTSQQWHNTAMSRP